MNLTFSKSSKPYIEGNKFASKYNIREITTVVIVVFLSSSQRSCYLRLTSIYVSLLINWCSPQLSLIFPSMMQRYVRSSIWTDRFPSPMIGSCDHIFRTTEPVYPNHRRRESHLVVHSKFSEIKILNFHLNKNS